MPLLIASISTSGKPSKREREHVDRGLRHLAGRRPRSGRRASTRSPMPSVVDPRLQARSARCPLPKIFSSQSGCARPPARTRGSGSRSPSAACSRPAARIRLALMSARGGSIVAHRVREPPHRRRRCRSSPRSYSLAVLLGEHGQRVELADSAGPSPCAAFLACEREVHLLEPDRDQPGHARGRRSACCGRAGWRSTMPRLAPRSRRTSCDVGPQVVVVLADVGRVVERAREAAQQRAQRPQVARRRARRAGRRAR